MSGPDVASEDARITRFLRKFRDLRAKSGRADIFDRFRELLDAYLLPIG